MKRNVDLAKPGFKTLGMDLLATTPLQRWSALLQPFLWFGAYLLLAHYRCWFALPFMILLVFHSVMSVTHDVVHRNLGLAKTSSNIALCLLGALVIASGHAYRVTHHQHHRSFPHGEDPEGAAARMCWWRALVEGPMFLPKLWLWAYQHGRQQNRDRAWLVLELLINASWVVAAILTWRTDPTVTIYTVCALGGGWLFPFLNVYLLHGHFEDSPRKHSHRVRGRLIPWAFAELAYHLEHHLYPKVPAHNIAKLAVRLDPYFDRQGIETIKMI